MRVRGLFSLWALLLCAGWAIADYGDKDPYELQSAIEVLEHSGAEVHRNGQVQIDIVVPGLGQADQVTTARLPSTYTLNVMGMESSPENLDAMLVLPEVDSLYLGPEFERTETAWNTLNKFGELKNLYIVDRLTNADLPQVAQFQELNLLAIRLGNFSPDNLWYLEAMHGLETLSLSVDQPLPPNYLNSMPAIPNLKHLELAFLADQKVSLAGIERLNSVTSIELDAQEHPVGNLSTIGQLSNLERLNLSSVQFDASDMQMFGELSQLQHLALFHCDLPASGEQHFARMRNLRRIDLNQVALTDAMLVQLAKLPQLTHLYVRGAPLTDEALPAIAASPSLKTIRLSGTKITPEGAKWLREQRPELNFVLTQGL